MPRPRKRTGGGGGAMAVALVPLAILVGAGLMIRSHLAAKEEADACQRFNDTMVRESMALNDVSTPFGRMLAEWSEGDPIERSRLQDACDRSIKMVDEVDRRVQALAVPDRATARAFHARMREFVGLERGFLESEVRPLVELLSDPATTKAQVLARVERFAGEISRQEAAKLAEVREAQSRFARELGACVK